MLPLWSQDLAFDLSLSALLGENIYNFGELLAHPIVSMNNRIKLICLQVYCTFVLEDLNFSLARMHFNICFKEMRVPQTCYNR